MRSASRRLFVAVGLTAAAMLLVELLLTRLFSIVFFYHYSFFAVSLVMSGLALGGVIASRMVDIDIAAASRRDSRLCLAASVLLALALAAPLTYQVQRPTPPLSHAVLVAVAFAPALTLGGAFLARAFQRAGAQVGSLYAVDLLAAGAACLAAIPLARLVPGPATLLLPSVLLALASVALNAGGTRWLAAILTWSTLLGSVIAAAVATDGNALHLRMTRAAIERWNEHSLVRFKGRPGGEGMLVIDRSAATRVMRMTPPLIGASTPFGSKPSARRQYLAYDAGRQIGRVAVIGVGGGMDVIAALSRGASHVDGFEINRLIVDLHRNELLPVTRIAALPEVTLVPEEGRVGIRRSGRAYDLIQASCIDTWAATASGGLVLSENGIYTREAWRTFLEALSPRGMLTMTRWYVPRAPAETQRLLSLAVAALKDVGIANPAGHVILAVPSNADRMGPSFATIVVSKAPFSRREARSLRGACADIGMRRLVSPPTTGGEPRDDASEDATLQALLDPDRREEAIATSPYDITPPDDLRPYFFLQLRPWQALLRRSRGFVLDITFRAVELLALLVVLALLLAAGVLAFGLLASPAAITMRRRYRIMTLYFLGIGLGYMLVQLGLHQRLILVLGHPTRALSLVLFSMLLGTGAGSFLSTRLFRAERHFPLAWASILVSLFVVTLGFRSLSRLEDVSTTARDLVTAMMVGAVGIVLGFGFPLGVRLAASAGEGVVPRLWAINGAASIAGSALAAVIGLSFGSRAVLLFGLGCYAAVALAGLAASRAREQGVT